MVCWLYELFSLRDPTTWSILPSEEEILLWCQLYFWEESLLYKLCKDGVCRCCLPEEEIQSVISHCHDSPCAGHASTSKTATKVLQAGFFWPSLFTHVHTYVYSCDRCQRMGNISRKNKKPLNFILEVEIFYVWGIDFIGLSRPPKVTSIFWLPWYLSPNVWRS